MKYQSAAFWGQTKKYVSSGASHHVAGCIMHVKIIYYVIKMKDGEGREWWRWRWGRAQPLYAR